MPEKTIFFERYSKSVPTPGPALFLDRDGVINVDTGYVYLKEDITFYDDVIPLIQRARAHGFKIVIVTNQAGIGREKYTHEQFLELTRWMAKFFEDNDAAIDSVYYSPFHPTAGLGKYKRHEGTRKPGPDMLLHACQALSIIKDRSIMVGDKYSDVKAAYNAGIPNRFLLSRQQQADDIPATSTVYSDAKTLFDICDFIEQSGG